MMHRALALFALLALASACGGKKASAEDISPPPLAGLAEDENLAVQGGVARFTEPTYYEMGIGLHAVAQGRSLTLSLRNKTGKTIQFLPRDFAIITSPRREDLIIINPGEGRIFTSDVEVPDGGLAFLRIDLNRVADVRGKRLVYNNVRDEIRFFIEIE